MAKDGMTLIVRGDAATAFEVFQRIWERGEIPSPKAKVTQKKSRPPTTARPKRASVQPRPKLEKVKVAKIPEVEVPVEGDWFQELQSLMKTEEKEEKEV